MVEVPIEHRREAVERIIERFGPPGEQLLVSARGAALAAKNFDAVIRFAEWVRAIRKMGEIIEWPRNSSAGTTFREADRESKALDVGGLIAQARRVHADMAELLKQTRRFEAVLNDPDIVDMVEMMRDVDLMIGAAAETFAARHGLELDPTDLAEIAVAVGRDDFDDDPKTAWHRWYKRRPAITRLMDCVRLKDSDGTALLTEDFYARL